MKQNMNLDKGKKEGEEVVRQKSTVYNKKAFFIVMGVLFIIVLIFGIVLNQNDRNILSQIESNKKEQATETIYINSKTDLIKFRDNVNKGRNANATVYLNIDINLSDLIWTPIGTYDHPFTGDFDGKRHIISGIKTVSSDGSIPDIAGLFGVVTNASIKNLGIEDSEIKGESCAGGIVGLITSSYGMTYIQNCYNKATVTSIEAGGLVGKGCQQTYIQRCYNEGRVFAGKTTSVLGNDSGGGIIGLFYCSSTIRIENCYNRGNITGIGPAQVGGLIGHCFDGKGGVLNIKNCYNVGKIKSDSEYNDYGGENYSAWSGEIIGAVTLNFNPMKPVGTVTLTDCYYLQNNNTNTIRQGYLGEGILGGEAKSNEYMQTSSFITNLGSSYWKFIELDEYKYPVLYWQPEPPSDKTYEVKYNANGGTGEMTSSQKKHGYENWIYLKENEFISPTGYKFYQWNTKPDGSGKSYYGGNIYSDNKDITLYAIWSQKAAPVYISDEEVYLYPNGGSWDEDCIEEAFPEEFIVSIGMLDKEDGVYIEKYTFAESNLPVEIYKKGYKFIGWNTKEDGTGELITRETEVPVDEGNIEKCKIQKLYAIWEEQITYQIRYDANGGSGEPDEQTKIEGTVLTLSKTIPSRTGYIFKGWSITRNATSATYQPGEEYIEDSDITLYAVWEVADKTSPTVTANPSNTTTYAKNYTINVTISEEVTDTSLYYYWHTSGTVAPTGTGAWPSVTINKSTNKATITANGKTGTYYLWIGSLTDTAGNRKANNCVGSYKFDNTVPTAPTITGTKASGQWSKDNVTITINGGSATSGIKKYQYSTNNGSTWTDYNASSKPVISTQGTTNVIARAVSNVDLNSSNTNAYEVKIDKTAPTVIANPSNTTTYAKNYTINVTISEEVTDTSLYYYWHTSGTVAPTGTGAWPSVTINKSTNKATITANGKTGTYYLWIGSLTDIAGNRKADNCVGSYKFDNTVPTAPTITGTKASEQWSKDNVTLTINGGSATSGIKGYQYSTNNGSTWTDYNASSKPVISTQGTTNVIARAVSNVNLTSNNTSTYVVKIDKKAPDIAVNQASSNEWKREYPIKVTVTDTGAGANNIKENGFAYYYTTDNKKAPGGYYWTRMGEDGTFPCTLTSGASTNATYYLWVNKVADDVGNDDGWRCIGGPYKLDTTAPTVPTITGTKASGQWSKDNVTLTINGGSATSGIKGYQYSTNNGSTWTDYNASSKPVINAEGTTNVIARAVSNVDLTSDNTSAYVVKIDKTAPTMNSITANPTSWTNGNVILTGKAIDTVSGISEYQFSQNSNLTAISSGWTNITNTKEQTTQTCTVLSNGTWYFYVKDAAGNINKNSVTAKIDKTVPSITLGSNSEETYTKAKNVQVTIADEASGLKSGASIKYGWSDSLEVAPTNYTNAQINYTQGAKSATFTATGSGLTGEYYLWIVPQNLKDIAENNNTEVLKSTGTFLFDNQEPSIGINPDGEEWVSERNYTQTKNITITIGDEHNGQINSSKLRYGWSKNQTDAPTEWKETNINNKQAVLNEVGGELTGEYYLWIDKGIQDGLGNSIQEYTKSKKPYYFDNIAPVLDLEATKGDGEITVEVRVTEEHSGLPTKTTFTYYIGTSPGNYRAVEITDQTGYKFTGLNQGTNYYIKVEATDNAGNKGEKTITSTTKIKVTGIKLEPNLAEIKVGESIQLEGKIIPENADNNKIIWTSSDGSTAVVDDNGRVVGKKEGTVTITATAEGGNTATSTIVVKARQINSGEISFSETMWKNNKASVTVTKQTEHYEIQYQKNSQDGPWIPLNKDEITDLSHGDIIYARLSDGTYHGEVISKQIIDEEKPELNVTGNITDWQSEKVTLEIQSYDMQSGLKQVTVNGEKVPLIGEIGKYEIKENGTYEIIAEDNAGNTRNKIEEIRYIDNKKPDIKVEKSTEEITNKNITLNIQITENESGLKQVTINGEEIKTNEGKIEHEIEENGTYKITAMDNCGNTEEKTITITNIDKTPPEAVVQYTIMETGVVKATIIANEKIKPVTGWTLSEDQTTLTKIYLKNTERPEQITIEDLAGNPSEEPVEIKIEGIDNEELRIEEIKYSNQEPTKDPVKVTITLNKEVQPIEGWELSENGMSLTKEYKENTTQRIPIKDLSGQTVIATIKINNIDKTAPEVEIGYSKTEYTNEDVTVTIKANEKIKEKEGWELSEDKTILTKKFDQNYVGQIEIEDELGNKKAVEISIMNIDKQAPTEPKIEIVSGQKGENDWYTGDVVVKIAGGEDLESGILKTTYEIKGTNNQEETIIQDGGMFRMTEEGTYQITAYSYDKALNKTKTSKPVEIKIDTRKPEIREIEKQIKTSSIRITTQAQDTISGIQSYSYYVNEELVQTGENPTYEMTKLSQDTQYKIQIKVKDNAGLETIVEEQTIKTEKVPGGADKDPSTPEDPENPVDKVEPDEVIEPEQTKGRNIEVTNPEWKDEKASVTVTTKTEYKIQYKIKENWETIESGDKIEELLHNDIILLRLTDGTNEGPYMSVIILDKQKPEEFTQEIEEITTNGFTVKAQTQDKQSGLDKYQIWINGENKGENKEGTFQITGLKQNTEYEVQIIAIDKAGNQRIADNSEEMQDGKITTNKIPSAGGEENQDDPIKPEQTNGKNIEVSSPEWKNERASVIVTTKTGYKIQYQKNEKQEGNWETVESGTKIEDLLHKDIIYLRLTDGINVGEYISVIIKDEKAPEKPEIKVIGGNIENGSYTIEVEVKITGGKDEQTGTDYTIYQIDDGEEIKITKDETIKITEEGKHKVKAYSVDKAGNKSEEKILEITIEKKEEPEDKYFRSKTYKITEEEILNISPKTTYKEFRNNIETNMEYQVETKEGKELGKEEYVGTGMKVKVEEKEYTLIVKGDTDGDGEVTIIDVARIQKHIIRNPKLEGESLKAGDTDLDGEVDLVDLAKAMKSVIGLIKL